VVEVTPEAHEEILKLLEQENIPAEEATLRVVLCAG